MPEAKLRVLLCYTDLLHYRLPILAELGRRYELTVAHSGSRKGGESFGFREVVLPVRKLGRLRLQRGLPRLHREVRPHAAIYFMDVAWLSILGGFIFCPSRCRRITWGLWMTRSPMANFVRLRLAHRAQCNLFYGDSAAEDFLRRGVPPHKVVVARNTVEVPNPGRNSESVRDSLLFVGSFDSRKQNDVSLRAFSNVIGRIPAGVRFVMIGNGNDRDAVAALIRALKIESRVELLPSITDPLVLRKHYDRAIASVSFGQAGLSVLQSLAHGVPFLTRKDAVTGGELENLIDGHNAILCDATQSSLEEAMVRVCCDQPAATTLGENSLRYYLANCTVSRMVDGFSRAIEGLPPP